MFCFMISISILLFSVLLFSLNTLITIGFCTTPDELIIDVQTGSNVIERDRRIFIGNKNLHMSCYLLSVYDISGFCNSHDLGFQNPSM